MKKSRIPLSTPEKSATSTPYRGLIRQKKPSHAEMSSRREMTKAEKKEESSRIMRIKAEAHELEHDNFSKIIVFDSGYPWYKIAFNSNLIYEYHVMPFIEEPFFKPRQDNDHYHFSRTGVTSVSDILSLAGVLKQMGAQIPETLDAHLPGGKLENKRLTKEEAEPIYIFDFKEGLSRAKVEAFLKAKEQNDVDLNELVLPGYVPQKLYPDMHLLAQYILEVVTRLPKEVRNVYGEKMATLSMRMLTEVNLACNGFGDAERTFRKTLQSVLFYAAGIQEILRVLLDARLIKLGSCQMILRMTIRVQEDAKQEIEALMKKDSVVVETIRRNKNFPHARGVDLSDKISEQSDDHQGYIKQHASV